MDRKFFTDNRHQQLTGQIKGVAFAACEIYFPGFGLVNTNLVSTMNIYRNQMISGLPATMTLKGHLFCSRVVETWRLSLE